MQEATIAKALSSARSLYADLQPAPIPKGWILDGCPVARGRMLHRSADAMAFVAAWECTSGRFNWFYDVDEMVYIVDGAVTITATSGQAHELAAGSTYFFPAGSQAHWHVPDCVRKIAFLHVPVSRKMRLAQAAYQFLKRPWRSRSGLLSAPEVLGGTAAADQPA